MSVTLWGAFLGLFAGAGLALVVARVQAIRRPPLEARLLPYLRDLPSVTPHGPASGGSDGTRSAAVGVFGPVLQSGADAVERLLGGGASVRRRLRRAGLDLTLHEFRLQQVTWGLVGFGVAAAYGVAQTLSGSGDVVRSAGLCLIGLAGGVLARDTHLTSQVRTRERRILQEFPTLSELLALAVAAGESPVAALDRVVRRSRGELSRDLAGVLSEIRTGEPVAAAFDRYAATTGLPVVARFAQGVAVAMERGTPLADVLHAQAADVREAGRRELIESAARREVFMMVPVVFLVLPTVVLFAFWPGWVGLSLSVG